MQQVVPLKVKIGLRFPDGRREADHPNFNAVLKAHDPPIEIDWAYWIEQFGGWQYDKLCGHKEQDAESPFGMQWGMLYVPRWFAEAAHAEFPDTCQIVSNVEAKRFHEDRSHAKEPEVVENTAILQGIAAKRAAGVDEDDDDRRALDPENPTPGRKKNRRKKQSDFLALYDLQLE